MDSLTLRLFDSADSPDSADSSTLSTPVTPPPRLLSSPPEESAFRFRLLTSVRFRPRTTAAIPGRQHGQHRSARLLPSYAPAPRPARWHSDAPRAFASGRQTPTSKSGTARGPQPRFAGGA